jgi:Spy/CpxP family protein refolding chaperone
MSLRLIRGFLLTALVAAFPLAVAAQVVPDNPPASAPNGPAAQPGVRPHVTPYMRALRGLNLSDAQRSQIRGIMQSYRQKNQGLDRTTRRANIRQMRHEILAVLSPGQRSNLRQQMQQYRQQHPQNPGQNRPAGN